MRSIKLINICKKYRDENVLTDLNLTIPSGKFFALLGPSGSGKTTLLRLIGGFTEVDSGKILLGDDDITNFPINERKINTVFQNYALFPHLNVFDNVAYGLKVRKVPNDIIKQKVSRMLEAVGLQTQMFKSINELSGGQKQRVALARAIINDPEVLLLDEPLAALDLKLREKMLVELVDLQDKLQTTFIYVTHDQTEALTVADQMAIMNYDGEIEQVGTPKEIYEYPASVFVAEFVGSTNIFPGVLEINIDSKKLDVEGIGKLNVDITSEKKWAQDGVKASLSLRPEKILISKSPVAGFSNQLTGTVESIVYHGRSTEYIVKLQNGKKIQAFEQNEEHFPKEVIDYDDKVNIYWQAENAILLEK
ncbi:MAG: Spermidine/putrescine import ATP-binding protein PotA [candidate division TM6 bacterium GW2011_GWF2_32_72]|nr:MAG: Spermidine/putrescine import ATP-binding protein PotA [candidate division TM6 bacterium GW2011_GWF2_32_72]